jgi:hypothetical protein
VGNDPTDLLWPGSVCARRDGTRTRRSVTRNDLEDERNATDSALGSHDAADGTRASEAPISSGLLR